MRFSSTATANRNFNKLLMCLAVVDSLLLVNLVAETAVMNTFMGSSGNIGFDIKGRVGKGGI